MSSSRAHAQQQPGLRTQEGGADDEDGGSEEEEEQHLLLRRSSPASDTIPADSVSSAAASVAHHRPPSAASACWCLHEYASTVCGRRGFALFLSVLCLNGLFYTSFLTFLPIFVEEKLGREQVTTV